MCFPPNECKYKPHKREEYKELWLHNCQYLTMIVLRSVFQFSRCIKCLRFHKVLPWRRLDHKSLCNSGSYWKNVSGPSLFTSLLNCWGLIVALQCYWNKLFNILVGKNVSFKTAFILSPHLRLFYFPSLYIKNI